jgi:DNA-binding NarL/FixJ family response regulator
MKKKISILIADDHKLFSHTLSLFIKDNTDGVITKIVEDGSQLLKALNETTVDLILLDINMPKQNGIEAAEKIKLNFPEIKIIAISQYSEKQIVDKAIEIGIDGYFIKNNDPEEFIDVFNRVMNGEKVFTQVKTKQQEESILVDAFEQKYQFTSREREVLRLIKCNYSNKRIAETLFLSEYTIESHAKSICKKLKTSDRKVVYKFAIDHF